MPPTISLPYPIQGSPAGTMAPSTQQQWAHDFAMHFSERLANGSLDGSEGSLFTNATFAKFGLTPFNQGDIGSGIWSQQSYNKLYQLGTKLATGGYGTLSPEQKAGLTDPGGLPDDPTPTLTEGDKSNITQISEGEKGRAAALEQTKLREAGETGRNNARIAADKEIAAGGWAVDRERIASNERIAASDRTSRETIAREDRAESRRQFDLRIAEDRRKTTVDTLVGLLDRGVELMKNPVDWIAYQFYMDEMDIPLNALTLSSAVATFGAIPPTGPSEVGPVIGGPAAIDGNYETATTLGIPNPGPVTLQQAVTQFPGGNAAVTGDWGARLNSQATVQMLGGFDVVDRALAESRSTILPQALGTTAFTQQAADISTRLMQPQQIGLPQQPQQGLDARMAAGGMQTQGMPAYNNLNNLPPGSSAGPSMVPTQPTPQPAQPPVNDFGRPMPPQTSATNVAGNGAAGGIYTGNEAGQPQAAVGMNGPVQAEQALAILANQLQMPIEQLRQLFPAHLMGTNASRDVIANSPVIQSLKAGAQGQSGMLSGFNTAPRPQQGVGAIGSISLPGQEPIPLGIRGGQDINAASYLSATPGQQGLIEGAVKSARMYWPDAVQQMLRASPVTSLEPGFTARRRF